MDLRDNIRLNTEVNLEGFIELSKKLSEIQLSVTSLAANARTLTTTMSQNTQATVNNATSLTNLTNQTNQATRATQSLFTSLNSLTKIRSELITLFGAYSLGSFAEQMIDAQSKVQAFELSMKNLLGGAYGSKLVADLKQFTVQTPLNFEEVIRATNTLVGSFKATGESSKTIGIEVPKILESLGNSAAALGGGDRLGRLIYAFSQVQAAGRLMGTEVRQVSEVGFPLLAVMSERSGKSVQQIRQDISDGKVSFEQFKDAILSAGKEGGVFAGSMDIMANTVRGRIDKLKESTFFALANIGNQFNDAAKSAIDFGASLVNSLFGTESATKRTIELVKTAIATWGAYTLATRLAASQTVINTAIDRASLILRGEMALATITLTGSTDSLTTAQLRSAVAARSFNSVLAANPLGLLIVSIGAVVGAYQLYSNSVNEAQEKQNKLFTDISNAVAPIKTQKEEFNNLANAVLSTSLSASEQQRILERLKAEYPLLLKGVNDLSTAEDILNKNKIKTNSTLDFRNARLDELKKKYPEQLKGIDTLAEAETKLATVVRLTNRDFAILSATMENNIRLQNQVAGANENFAKKIQAQAELAKLRAGQTGANLVDFGGNIVNNTPALIAAKEREIASYDKAAKEFVKSAEVIRAKNEELTSKLKYNWDGIPKTIEKTGKEGKEKALKYQSDTAEQMRIASNKIIAEDLEDSRQKDLILRNLEYRNQQERINNAIGSQKIKNKLLLDLEQEYDANISKIHQSWNEKDRKERIKAEKEKNKELEKEAMDSAERLWKIISDRISDELKAKEKLIDEIQKLDEKNSKESVKLEEDKYKLIDKLRVLQAISRAKSSKEIIELENKEKESILNLNKDSIEKQIIAEKSKLYKMWLLKKENTLEYKEQQGIILKLEQDLADAQIKLAEFVTEKTKDEIEKGVRYRKDGIQDVAQSLSKSMSIMESYSSAFFSALDSMINDSLSNSSDAVSKAQAENQKAGLEIAKQGMSAIQSFINGDIISGTLKAFNALYGAVTLIGNNASRMAKAQMEVAAEALENYLGVVEVGVDKIMSRFDDIKEAYGEIKLESGATIGGTLSKDLGLDAALKSLWSVATAIKEISKDIINVPPLDLGSTLLDFKTLDEWRLAIGITGRSVDELIQAEITRGQQIQKTYEQAISKENDLYNTNISNIEKEYSKKLESIDNSKKEATDAANEIYDNEIKRINDNYNLAIKNINAKYDLEDIRANQRYSADTLAIMQVGSTQLEALIKNEESLNSVRQDFASKRQYILDSYALANKAITSDMSQEEIDGINAAIKARDEALAKLQKWYNDELTFIVNSEGQKRKQYSETEKIQNEINDRLDKAAIKFSADSIKREVDKNIELAKEREIKDAAELDAETKKSESLIVIKGKYESDKADLEELYNSIKEVEEDRHTATIVALNKKKDEDIATSFKILTELLKVYSEDITKAMEDTVAKGSDAYKRLAQELNIVNELLKQIRNNSDSTPLNIGINGGLNITPFEKGTDNTSVSLAGQRVVDNKGGWTAILHPQEAVFSKADMSQMETVFGKRPTRQEVIDTFKLGVINQTIPQINPYVIQKMQANGIGNFDKLGDKIEKLAKEVSKKMTPVVYMDKGGVRVFYKNLNTQIEIKNQRFR